MFARFVLQDFPEKTFAPRRRTACTNSDNDNLLFSPVDPGFFPLELLALLRSGGGFVEGDRLENPAGGWAISQQQHAPPYPDTVRIQRIRRR